MSAANPALSANHPRDSLRSSRGLAGLQLLDVDVLELDVSVFAVLLGVLLQLDRSLRGQRLECSQRRLVDDKLVVQVNRGVLTFHDDAKVVPLARGLVGILERVLAPGSLGVVPQTAGALPLVGSKI